MKILFSLDHKIKLLLALKAIALEHRYLSIQCVVPSADYRTGCYGNVTQGYLGEQRSEKALFYVRNTRSRTSRMTEKKV